MAWSSDPDHPLWFDTPMRERFRNERTARFGSQLLDHDPDDDFGSDLEVKLPDPWLVVA